MLREVTLAKWRRFRVKCQKCLVLIFSQAFFSRFPKMESSQFEEGLVQHYEPELKKIENHISELTSKQAGLLKDLQKENVKFSSVDIAELTSLFHTMKEYQSRLVTMKKDMIAVAEKSEQLKKRATKLQEHKQKIALENAHYREAQLKREQDLIGKPGQL